MKADKEFLLDIYKKAPEHLFVQEEQEAEENEYCHCNYPTLLNDDDTECEWCGKDIEPIW